MRIKQHIPNFCSGLEPQEVEFNNLAELMAIPWVKHWTDDKDFFRFSISDGRYLMAEAHTGRIWWVVGYLTDCQLDLPKHERVTAAPIPRPTEIEHDHKKPFVVPEGWEIKFQERLGDYDCGWWVRMCETDSCLHKDLTLHHGVGWLIEHKFGETPGYWPTKKAAEDALVAYLKKENATRQNNKGL